MNDERFRRWLDGETDVMEHILDGKRGHDLPRQDQRRLQREAEEVAVVRMGRVIHSERRLFSAWYRVAAVLCCLVLMVVFLYMVAHITRYGAENPRATEITERYVEHGLEETGAVNIVAGMILDYRAFDTLGESHVLFTALICVMILLRRDQKNMRTAYEDYYRISEEDYFPTDRDQIARRVGGVLTPCILLFGIYILLNGQISPGGGFSGGAVLGAGLVIFASTRGDSAVDRFLTKRVFHWAAFCALSFYSFAKGYVFFMGANGLENHIPKGVPGAILSGGLILPLDIAVGLVVACTMFGFYSLFRRGTIAEEGAAGTVSGDNTAGTVAGDTATGGATGTVSRDATTGGAAENVSGDAIADNTADKEES
ncbi:MAG: hypothetical protein IJT31_08480 [Oscillibacter sp.]|nr:hypothetical protein [Oscillibacter sp.]